MKPSEAKPVPPEFLPDEDELARQLLNLRRPPSPTLQRRVQSIPQPETSPTRTVPRGIVGGVIALLTMALLFISPPVQATLDEVQGVLGQFPLTIRSVWPKPTETVVVLEAEPMSLREAQAALPFDFVLPAHLPNGLTSTADQIFVSQSPLPMAKMEWRDIEGGFVQLSAFASGPENHRSQTLIGPESTETILINNQEAVLVRGGWDGESRTWSHQGQVTTLIWTANGVQYRLLSYGDVVPLAELIKMAESVR
jgi:hypothetical protein